nr:chymotrypsin-like protease CTRL-1 [Drosophila bipectinata]
MVLLEGRLLCGGSLITNRFVLTAAHCQSELKTYATLGEYFRGFDVGLERKIPVDLQIPHPDYNRDKHKNDIALFRLSRPVEYTMHIRPICLPTNYDALDVVRNLNVTGWGRTSYNATTSSVLMTATVLVHDRSTCRNLGNIDESQVCVGPADGNPCNGDSGGPLTSLVNFQGSGTVTVQIGLVSFGIWGCQSLSVHTHVYHYMAWISEMVRTHKTDINENKDYSFENI